MVERHHCRWLLTVDAANCCVGLFGQKKLVVARQAEPILIILMADDDLAVAIHDGAEEDAADGTACRGVRD